MKIYQYNEPHEFYNLSIGFLEKKMAENNLLLGILENLKENIHYYTKAQPLMLSLVEDNICSIALMTPPYNIILSKTKDEHIDQLINYIREKKINIPGVLAPRETAHNFAKKYTDKFSVSMHERIYELTQVKIPKKTSGRFRRAKENERGLILEWAKGFAKDAKLNSLNTSRVVDMVTRKISDGTLYIWDDQGPRSMAGHNGNRIGYVYTPKKYRNQGYASAITARLSQYLLDNGESSCYLFTDLNNPTSNSIYQNIGYREIIDVDQIDFLT